MAMPILAPTSTESSLRLKLLLQGPHDALGAGEGLVHRVEAGQEDGELVPAQAGDGVLLAQGGHDAVGHLP